MAVFDFNKSLIVPICLLMLASWSEAQAQPGGKSRGGGSGFDVTLILKRLDTNGNGRLDPAETKGGTERFIRRAGLDPSKPHAISTIANLLNNPTGNKNAQNQNQNQANNGGELARKVPGFGVDVEQEGIADFSPSGEERMTVDAMKQKFGDNIMVQVERTLTRYDKNKSGILEANEIARSRWTNPSSEESDTNKDGRLSRLELAYRYKGREDAARNRSNKASRRTANKPNPKLNRNATAGRSAGATNNRRRSTNNNSKSVGFNDRSDAYQRYAEGLMKSYDKNKDGKLSKEELGEMRRPPENADTNSDGFVTKPELVAALTRRSGGNPANESASSSGRDRNSGLRRPRGKQYNVSDSVFGDRDLNSDGQLQMSEFADEWTEKTVAEFEEKDANGDGVITEREWTS